MKKLSFARKGVLFVIALLIASGGVTLAVDRNNEDEVVKIDARMSHFEYRENEVIVKFSSSTPLKIRANSAGRFASSGNSGIDAKMQEIGVNVVEELMPMSGNDVTRKKSKSYAGTDVVNTDLSKLYRVTFDSSKVKSVYDVVETLEELPEVVYAEPNYIVYSTGKGHCDKWKNEPLFTEQWGLEAINLPKLWEVETITDIHPIIGILDTGVDIEHPDLMGNIWTNESEANGAEESDDDGNGFADDLHGWDFVNQTGRIGDWNGHGTHCAGIAAADGVNEKGVAGANPDALIMPITVLQSDGVGDIATLIKGIDYAIANGATVISMSLGTYAESIALEEALGKAYQKAVLVAAAGNDGICIYPHKCVNPVTGLKELGSPSFPAAYTFVLGVQASGNNGMTSWSNYDEDGPIYSNPDYYGEEKLYNYELMAPGQSIMSSFLNGQYKLLNGTSMACPMVAGAVSRLLQCKEYANKEILFGDLIHATMPNGNVDIFGAYSISEADRMPTLHHVTNLLDDSEGGDGDKRADSGETIYLYPTLRNDWGNAMNIKITLEMGENEDETLIEFISNDVAFGNLSSYAKSKSVNPIIFKVNENCVDGRHIKLRLRATCDNISSEMVQDFTIAVENGVEIGGLIEEDLILYPDVHYIVTKSLAVPDGVKLTINPGTIIKFKPDTGLSLSSDAILDCVGEPGNMITFTMTNPERFVGFKCDDSNDCIFKYCMFENICVDDFNYLFYGCNIENSIIKDNSFGFFSWGYDEIISNCNIIKNSFGFFVAVISNNNNIINNNNNFRDNYIFNGFESIHGVDIVCLRSCHVFNFVNGDFIESGYYDSSTPHLYTTEYPCYFGTGREDIARERIRDMENPYNPIGFGKVDLSNMLTTPNPECHGIVWKVVVNGYDAQDEYELLPPLGVGKHKFEVYFNRAMNKEAIPTIAMGVRPPYTQTSIAEDGSWNEEGTIYTAYLTISGKDAIDGVNRIYVADAEDDEYFEIPVEDYRFNVNVQSAGSMSSGFMADAGLGKVNLTWENPEENFDDMLGYNLYRYTMVDEMPSDTIRINKTLLEPAETEFSDYDVVPGETYYYYYKVLRTSLTENSPSKIVAATPLTASKGDANGSMSVDVADIVTEVAYMTNQNPQPFIFEAADVNSDLSVNVLDVVGTVNIIKNPDAASAASINNTATYTIEDGILYVDTPVALGGLQFRLSAPQDATLTALDDLSAFEVVKDYQEETGWLILAYSMSGKTLSVGKHAIMNIGQAEITEVVLSDATGRNVMAYSGDVNGIGAIEAMQMQLPYPNPFRESLNIPYIIGQEGIHDVVISISTPTGIVVDVYTTECDFGYYNYVWTPSSNLGSGIYFITLNVDGRQMQTSRVIYKK